MPTTNGGSGLAATSPSPYIKTDDIKTDEISIDEIKIDEIEMAIDTVRRAEEGAVTEKDFDVQGFARDINELLILSTLRSEAKHGYQIALDVETDSNGLFRFRHGTLYPILHRLEGLRGQTSFLPARKNSVVPRVFRANQSPTPTVTAK